MKLTVLTENTAGGRLLAEHGLSFFIENQGRKILFDTGHSKVFLQNAERMGVHIQKEVDTIVLSHGHWDHGDGLQFLSKNTLVAHPSAFIKRYRKGDRTPIGLALTKSDVKKKFNLITSAKPYKLSESAIFLGEIPRSNDFEAKDTSFIDGEGNPDFVPDDSALAIIKENGLHIIAGCAHAGICNIMEYAKQITGIENVNAVFGGFHLKDNNHQTTETIRYFKHENIRYIYPSHCTELPALHEFYNAFGIRQLKTGMVLEF